MNRTLFPLEHYKFLEAVRQRNAYRDMALVMQQALKEIAIGASGASAQKIALRTLEKLSKEHGNGLE